jgi:preprotein translocase subunit YajC
MSLLDFFISPAAAQAAAGAPQAAPFSPILLFGGMAVLMYFFMIRPQTKKAKEHRELLAGLAKGDEVLTIGGIAGRIDHIDDPFVTVEIADGVRVKLQKVAIAAVLPKGTLKSA